MPGHRLPLNEAHKPPQQALEAHSAQQRQAARLRRWLAKAPRLRAKSAACLALNQPLRPQAVLVLDWLHRLRKRPACRHWRRLVPLWLAAWLVLRRCFLGARLCLGWRRPPKKPRSAASP